MSLSHGDLNQSLLCSRAVSTCILAGGINHGEDKQKYLQTQRKFIFALCLAFIFMIVEVGGGIAAGSLAIITDAAHLLSDVSGLAVSAFAAFYASKASHYHFSYGYHRIEVLGALASVLSVWAVTGVLLWEAVGRILNPDPVNGKIMFTVAVIGVLVNIVLVLILGDNHGHSHRDDEEHNHPKENINERSAVVHVIGDLLQSIGVAIAGALIWYYQDDPRWVIADPICTFLFAALVLWSTFDIVRDISDILMERVPRGIDVPKIQEDILSFEGVENVHDLHVWSLKPGISLLCAHVVVTPDADHATILQAVTGYCRQLGIVHTTIQIFIADFNEEDGIARCTCGVSSAATSMRGSISSFTA